jgi:hypothetical protein
MAFDETVAYSDLVTEQSDNYEGDNRTELFISLLPPLSFTYSVNNQVEINNRAYEREVTRKKRAKIKNHIELKARLKNYLNGDETDFDEKIFLALYQNITHDFLTRDSEIGEYIKANEIDQNTLVGKILIAIYLAEYIVNTLTPITLEEVRAKDLFLGK